MRRSGSVVQQVTGKDAEARTFEAQPFDADVKAALSWLDKALGFETTTIIESAAGGIRAHVANGDSMIAPASEGVEAAGRRQVRKGPASVGGVNTQAIEVQQQEDVDAHCERARAAGAVILREPKDEP